MSVEDVVTSDDRAKVIKGWVKEHLKKSKVKGDHHFRVAVGWTGDGDYSESDWGEHYNNK